MSTDDRKGVTWSIETFGQCGPPLRRFLGDFVHSSHQKLANAQGTADMREKHVYGNVARRVSEKLPKEISAKLPPQYVEVIKVPKANHPVVAVNGVALYPVRYAATPDKPDGFRLRSPSDLRRGILEGSNPTLNTAGQDRLALEWDIPEDLLTAEERQIADDLARIREDLDYLNRTRPPVVLVLFASRHDALYHVGWGTGRLDDDNILHLSGTKDGVPFFYEDLSWNEQPSSAEAIERDLAVGDAGPGASDGSDPAREAGGFNAGPPPEPPVRPRPPEDLTEDTDDQGTP